MLVASLLLVPAASYAQNLFHAYGGYWSSRDALYSCEILDPGAHSAWCPNVVVEGADRWSSFDLTQVQPGHPGRDITAYVGLYDDDDWYGLTVHWDGNDAQPYFSKTVRISRFNLHLNDGAHVANFGSSASTTDKACTAAHEWGHVIGLRHHDDTNGTIMRTGHGDRCGHGSFGGTHPSTHDASDVDWLYDEHAN